VSRDALRRASRSQEPAGLRRGIGEKRERRGKKRDEEERGAEKTRRVAGSRSALGRAVGQCGGSRATEDSQPDFAHRRFLSARRSAEWKKTRADGAGTRADVSWALSEGQRGPPAATGSEARSHRTRSKLSQAVTTAP